MKLFSNQLKGKGKRGATEAASRPGMAPRSDARPYGAIQEPPGASAAKEVSPAATQPGGATLPAQQDTPKPASSFDPNLDLFKAFETQSVTDEGLRFLASQVEPVSARELAATARAFAREVGVSTPAGGR